ncbi:putative thiamine pyrophosphokinase 1 isoform X2 [Iris pallida]|uniref:Thiamine pyrophosphokinase 1 isoform X2 n=1 Tax=Iris pallida TaxID=29817 RepID=A0AAX6ES25_IRIPA|nr:putative thiamine pyrophosphokinase 1 isoform X2 [Iris pallida]
MAMEVDGEICPHSEQSLVVEIGAQVGVLGGSFSWWEAKCVVAKRVVHVRAELAKNGGRERESAILGLNFVQFFPQRSTATTT